MILFLSNVLQWIVLYSENSYALKIHNMHEIFLR